MHRIDTSTAQVDKFGAGKNGFTGGNPQTGELPTALDADFFDSLQEELSAVIEASGLTLDKTKNNQLLNSILSMVGHGRLINIKTITTSGNYVKTPGTTKAKAFALGGGGAGGGCAATGASQSSAGKGGNGGAFGWTTLLDMTSVSSVACTVGSAGIGSLGADGGSGGNTSFGAYITAPGGSGGSNGAVASALTVTSSNDPGIECSGSAVEISVRASRGTGKVVLGTGSGQAYSGAGGSSPYGNGGGSVTNGLGGQPGYGYGAGGGSVVNPASQATAQSGGNGSGGLIIVWEYA